MRPYLFNTFLGILAFIVLILPFTGKVHDARSIWYKRLTVRGWIVCLAFIGSIVLGYFKDLQNETDEHAKTQSAIIQKHKDDSINKKYNLDIVAALARNGYEYDSTQKKILKAVRDSAKKIIERTTPVNPSLDICDIKDTSKFLVNICASKSTAYNIRLKCYQAFMLNGTYFFVNSETPYFFARNGTLAVDKKFTGELNFTNLNSHTQYVFFLFTGVYTNEENKSFLLNNIYEYDFQKKNWGMENEPYYSQTADFFHKQGLVF